MIITRIFLIICVIWFICVVKAVEKAEGDEVKEKKPQISPAAKFDELFRLRVKHDVAESVAIMKKPMEVKQAKSLVEKVLETITQDMKKLREEQLLKVPASMEGLLSGTVSETDINAFVNLATNLLVFSNVVLYQPDLSRDYLKKDAAKDDAISALSVVQWASAYCRETGMFTNHTKMDKVVKLMEQELQLVPRDENYQNPYAHRHKVELAREEFEQKQKELEKERVNKAKSKLKKPLKKKPKSDEL